MGILVSFQVLGRCVACFWDPSVDKRAPQAGKVVETSIPKATATKMYNKRPSQQRAGCHEPTMFILENVDLDSDTSTATAVGSDSESNVSLSLQALTADVQRPSVAPVRARLRFAPAQNQAVLCRVQCQDPGAGELAEAGMQPSAQPPAARPDWQVLPYRRLSDTYGGSGQRVHMRAWLKNLYWSTTQEKFGVPKDQVTTQKHIYGSSHRKTKYLLFEYFGPPKKSPIIARILSFRDRKQAVEVDLGCRCSSRKATCQQSHTAQRFFRGVPEVVLRTSSKGACRLDPGICQASYYSGAALSASPSFFRGGCRSWPLMYNAQELARCSARTTEA